MVVYSQEVIFALTKEPFRQGSAGVLRGVQKWTALGNGSRRCLHQRAEDLPRTNVVCFFSNYDGGEGRVHSRILVRFQGCAKMRQNIQGATRIEVDGLKYSWTSPAHGILS